MNNLFIITILLVILPMSIQFLLYVLYKEKLLELETKLEIKILDTEIKSREEWFSDLTKIIDILKDMNSQLSGTSKLSQSNSREIHDLIKLVNEIKNSDIQYDEIESIKSTLNKLDEDLKTLRNNL